MITVSLKHNKIIKHNHMPYFRAAISTILLAFEPGNQGSSPAICRPTNFWAVLGIIRKPRDKEIVATATTKRNIVVIQEFQIIQQENR